MSQVSNEANEENERTKGKDRGIESKRTLMLKRNIQRVELQGKRGKIKNITTQITKELLEYIKQNFDGYSLLVLSYIILGVLISIRKLLLNAFLDTDEFLNEKLGLAKARASKNQSRAKSKNLNNILSNKELTAETLRTLFNKSLMSEFEKFKSSKIHLSQDLFDKIQSTLYKMKIPTMIGVTEQDVMKFEEEKIINPLFKKLFTEPLPNKAIVQLIKDSQQDTKNFADLVGINVDNIINKEGVLDNGQYFPNEENNNDIQDFNDNNNELNFHSQDKKELNIKLELIKKSINDEENLMDRNNIVWKKDKEFLEFDIPTYLEMTKEENEDMTIDDIKKAFYKNLEKVNSDAEFCQFKKNLIKNKYNLTVEEFYNCPSIQKDIKTLNLFGYYFYGNGKDFVSYIKNEILSSGNSSDRKRYDIGELLTSDKMIINNEPESSLNDIKGKTYNLFNNMELTLDDTSFVELSSQIKNRNGSDSKTLLDDNIEKEERTSSEIIKELKKVVSKTKFYQNVKVSNFVDAINENTFLINEYNEKEKKSFVFYNLLISCQANGFNLQQNNLFSDFFFAKNN